MSSTKASEVLAGLSAGKTSGWSERARQRQAGRGWLRRSRRIALHVLNALEAKSMSQKDLAAAISVTPQYISKLLKGGENLSLETISRIEAALGIALIEVRDCAHTISIKPQKVKAIPWPAGSIAVCTTRLIYNNRAQGMSLIPEHGYSYRTIAQC